MGARRLTSIRRRVLQTLAVVAGVLLLVAVLLALWLRHEEERIVFQPTRPPHPTAEGSDVRRLDFRAEDGRALFAYLVGEADPARDGLVIAFHGNADLAARRVPWAREAARRSGRAVLLPEWRGYGGLAGPPTAAGVRLDARAALRIALDTLRTRRDRVAVYGHSLGSAVAAELAAEMGAAGAPPDALLLESPFSSARAMADVVMGPAVDRVWGAIARVRYDTRARVAALDAPVSVIHGTDDCVIPAIMGREVFAAARRRGRLLLIDGGGHGDLPETGGDAYWRWLAEALDPFSR